MDGILTSAAYRPLLEAFKSALNAAVYGGKLRASHALVINLIYGRGPMEPRIRGIFRAAKAHASVLAAFALIYKAVCRVLSHDELLGSSNPLVVKLLAGAFGSWIVYSHSFPWFNEGITHQITLYCFSRVVIAVGKIIVEKGLECSKPSFQTVSGEKLLFTELSQAQQRKFKTKIYNKSWKWFAIIVWALVMMIYDYRPEYLQSSLRHSMAYIYDVENDYWPTWKAFFGF
ncbi:hypothetical protein DICA3_C07074 [Diutina catenulata]